MNAPFSAVGTPLPGKSLPVPEIENSNLITNNVGEDLSVKTNQNNSEGECVLWLFFVFYC